MRSKRRSIRPIASAPWRWGAAQAAGGGRSRPGNGRRFPWKAGVISLPEGAMNASAITSVFRQPWLASPARNRGRNRRCTGSRCRAPVARHGSARSQERVALQARRRPEIDRSRRRLAALGDRQLAASHCLWLLLAIRVEPFGIVESWFVAEMESAIARGSFAKVSVETFILSRRRPHAALRIQL